MQILKDFCDFIAESTGLDSGVLYVILLTIIAGAFIKIVKMILKKVFGKYDARTAYTMYQKSNVVLTIIYAFLTLLIWDQYIDNVITIISFISAAMTLALRDFVYNFFAGIYIKIKKPFSLEHRIELNDIKGDVVSLNAFSFEILEVGNNVNADQSTGRIINIPNSLALTSPLKNYEKNFKYIWNELTVRTKLDCDIELTKEKLLEIVNSNEVVKRIPKKMENEMEDISLDYRIYYNKLDPIIYCRVVDTHLEFYIRYLVHPKKTRYVEDDIWSKIIQAYKEGIIKLDDGK